MKKKKKIEALLRDVDWEKIMETVEALDWQWYHHKRPTIFELQKLAEKMLMELTTSKNSVISVGGLTVLVDKYGHLHLFFGPHASSMS